MSQYSGIHRKKCEISKEITKKLELKQKFTPTDLQQNTTNYFLKSPYKGILLFHQLGAGKTCTSILIADAMIKQKKINHVYVFSTGSLRQNYVDEYCKKCGSNDLEKYFTFITYNYNILDGLKVLDLNNSLVIIDEVHKLINGVKNNSTIPLEIYKKLVNSDCKIVALSGTPIFSYTYEWPLVGLLLNPEEYKNHVLIKEGKIILENWQESVTDKKIQGIVSYYPGDPEYYPTVYYRDPIYVQMSTRQAEIFQKKLEYENKVRLNPPDENLKFTDPTRYEKEQEKYIMAVKYILSRSVANFFYPTDESKQKPDASITNKGWIRPNEFNDQQLLYLYSPKFTAVLLNIVLNLDTKHVIYSFFKEKSGIMMFKYLLDRCGISNEIYSGDIDDRKRVRILSKFNNKDNINGDKIKVLLLTEAGAEGITLKDVNNFHILESSKEHLIKQAIGRVVRYKSHENLPENRHYVNIWRYFSYSYAKQDSLDLYLYEKGKQDIENINVFLEKIIENSIERM